eukprot:CAMPEP_0116557726 /NCGR_PEP_ID=MMETSP0397-20121206/9403_1 /TAXON_ID=216820 /ORGANISM="Cyclophora tenuis, Strain ECT3854" /LENGTH=148 /DNA_ID=CAMNT_0004083221 /DNA_START=170 /DNA_END=613 /DNA_ORIENTATION=-
MSTLSLLSPRTILHFRSPSHRTNFLDEYNPRGIVVVVVDGGFGFMSSQLIDSKRLLSKIPLRRLFVSVLGVSVVGGVVESFAELVVDDGADAEHPCHVPGVVAYFHGPSSSKGEGAAFLVHAAYDRDEVTGGAGWQRFLGIGNHGIEW